MKASSYNFRERQLAWRNSGVTATRTQILQHLKSMSLNETDYKTYARAFLGLEERAYTMGEVEDILDKAAGDNACSSNSYIYPDELVIKAKAPFVAAWFLNRQGIPLRVH